MRKRHASQYANFGSLHYASQGNAAAADKEKSSCPCFSVAVRFQGGKRKRHICGWTSVGLVDIDHLEKAALPELLKRIVADPHTLLTYTTISGAGIRILYRVEHDENTLQRAVASPLDENAYLASEGKLPILGYPLLDGRQSAPV